MQSKIDYLRSLTQELNRKETKTRDFERFMEALPFGIFIVGRDEAFRYTNETARVLFGENLEVPLDTIRKSVEQAFEGSVSLLDNVEIDLCDGRHVSASVWSSPVWDAEKRVTHVLIAFCTSSLLGDNEDVQ